jgi:hypothetical protein
MTCDRCSVCTTTPCTLSDPVWSGSYDSSVSAVCRLAKADLGFELRRFEEEALAYGRRGTIDEEPRENVLYRSNRPYTTRYEASSSHCQQAKAAFVLTEYAYWARIHGWDDVLQRRVTGRLDLAN